MATSNEGLTASVLSANGPPGLPCPSWGWRPPSTEAKPQLTFHATRAARTGEAIRRFIELVRHMSR